MRMKVIISNTMKFEEILTKKVSQNMMISMMMNSNGTIRNTMRGKNKMISLMEVALHLV